MVICAPSSVVAVKVATHASNLGRVGLEIMLVIAAVYLFQRYVPYGIYYMLKKLKWEKRR